MKSYIKPEVLELEDIAEGIYADGSGADGNDGGNNGGNNGGDSGNDPDNDPENNPYKCWSVNVSRQEGDKGRLEYSQWTVHAFHDNSIWHISRGTIVTITFSDPVTDARCQGFNATTSGSTVTLTRDNHGNSDQSGDEYTVLLEMFGPKTHTMTVVGSSIECIMERGVNQPNP